jgi:hypothetical protein
MVGASNGASRTPKLSGAPGGGFAKDTTVGVKGGDTAGSIRQQLAHRLDREIQRL